MNTSNSPAFDTRPTRKKGYYNSAKEIEKKIDEARNEAVQLQKQADELDAKADTARDTQVGMGYILGWRMEAKKLREQAARKIDVRCKFLKEKLAAFLTETLPFSEPELQVKNLPKVGLDKFLDRAKQ